MISLGTLVDGRSLYYDAALYEFRIGRSVAAYAEVAELDANAHISWLAPEQHDWFIRINPQDLDRCNRQALNRHGNAYAGLSPEEQVQADAKRDDSVLAGKIVDADPALVRAVADALEQQGLLGGGAPAGAAQPVIGMPQGMEALSQLQKQEGRKMTLMEHFLMRQILKADDKDKLKREKEAAALEEAAAKEEAAEEKQLKSKAHIFKAQKRVAKREAQKERDLRDRSAHMQVEKHNPDPNAPMSIDDALAAASASGAARMHAGHGHPHAPNQQPVVYYDSYGNPIAPEPDAISPSASQQRYQPSAEEEALTAMRERNLAHQAQMVANTNYDVPGMEGAGKRKRGSAMINGRAVNADGTPVENGFTKFVGGLGKVADALSPLAGGGRGMGGGGGAGGAGGGMPGGGMGGGGMGGM